MTFVRTAIQKGGMVLALSVLCTATPGTAHADGNVMAGRDTAQKCETCHGLDGLSKVVEAPNLAGQTQPYIIKQLHAFKSGERQNEMMGVVAPSLTDKEIEDLAAYYSAISINVVKIPGQ